MESLPSVGSTSSEETIFNGARSGFCKTVASAKASWSRKVSRDLRVAGFNRILNGRRVGLQFAVQDNGQPLADIIARYISKSFCPVTGEREVDLRVAKIVARHVRAFHDVPGEAVPPGFFFTINSSIA